MEGHAGPFPTAIRCVGASAETDEPVALRFQEAPETRGLALLTLPLLTGVSAAYDASGAHDLWPCRVVMSDFRGETTTCPSVWSRAGSELPGMRGGGTGKGRSAKSPAPHPIPRGHES